MNMAEVYGAALRLVLLSADLFNERAIFRGSFHVNTSRSKSSALLFFVTALDHLCFGIFKGFGDGSSAEPRPVPYIFIQGQVWDCRENRPY